MAYSPITRLAYVPGQNAAFSFAQDPQFQFKEGKQNFGVNLRESLCSFVRRVPMN